MKIKKIILKKYSERNNKKHEKKNKFKDSEIMIEKGRKKELTVPVVGRVREHKFHLGVGGEGVV